MVNCNKRDAAVGKGRGMNVLVPPGSTWGKGFDLERAIVGLNGWPRELRPRLQPFCSGNVEI